MSTLLSAIPTSSARASVFLLLVACALCVVRGARAQPFELPPEPQARPPRRAIEVTAGLSGTLVRGAICPSGEGCVHGGGGRIGVLLERRLPRGFAFGVGYDLMLLDGQTVYELTVVQRLFVNVRQYFAPRLAVHPYLSAGGGVAILGDAFLVDTGGVVGHADAGLEVELSENVAFTGSLGFRMAWYLPYTSEVDEVRRGRGGAPTIAFVVGIGLVIVSGPR